MYVSKSDIKQALFNHQYCDLKSELEKSSKLEAIKHEDFTSVQDYFSDKSIESCRMAFRVRCLMVKDIPGNFKEKYKKKGDEALICTHSDDRLILTQSHCLQCPAWEELNRGLDLTDIRDLSKFFRKLLDERLRLDRLNV